ncbi:hypothetical protein LTR37_001492 [Vermiconidia calcicola]|uniref:Uncharacterized protein n=1 Tax=Vermiconidia calcicola TaxID=1690605 RepID=A0ACC3NXN0_9PEZI|nr:hypothetical protein LTR37_001492 [Vermiconidia calcicola]
MPNSSASRISRTLGRMKHLIMSRHSRKRPGAAVQDEGSAEPVDQEIGSGIAEDVIEVVDEESADGDDEGAPVAVDEEKIQYGEAHLLGMPAEIRNRIYDFAVPKGNTYLLKTSYPPICRISHRLLSETGPIWRFCNTFILYVDLWQNFRQPQLVSDDHRYIKSLRIILEVPIFLNIPGKLFSNTAREALCINIDTNKYGISRCTCSRSGGAFHLKNLCRLSLEREAEEFRLQAGMRAFLEHVLEKEFVQAINEETIDCVAH